MLRVTNDIHLKNNEVLFRIQNSEQLYNAVSFYGPKLLINDDHKYSIKICQRLRKRDNLEKIKVIEGLDYGNSNLLFENTNIIVKINQYGKPLINESGSQFYDEMEVQIINNENTIEENKEIAKKFFIKSIEHYTQEHLDQKKESNRTTIYIWDDGFWETLEKGISRNIKTIYLDGKEIEIKDQIKNFLSNEEETKYANFGVPWKLNLLFHGNLKNFKDGDGFLKAEVK